MLDNELQTKLNEQINIELQAAYLYFSMATYFDSLSLDGFSHWMKTQAQEELGHAMKVYQYLSDQGAHAEMLAIPAPATKFDSPLQAFELALGHEKKLAATLNDISVLATEKRDNTTSSFLDWFLTEQVEEVALVNTIVDKLKMIGDNGFGILMMSNELGQRQAEPAPEG
jgi:ferritin